MPDIIKPKRATKSVADKSDKVLEKDELLLISPNTGSGTGRYGVKIGDGVTPAKDLPYAMDGEKANEMIVSEFSEESNENPVLSPGDKIKTLCGKLLKKFNYLETLLGKKVNTSDIYDGTDSSSTTKVATANSVRQVNEKADNNTNQINQLNSNIASIQNGLTAVQFTGDINNLRNQSLDMNAQKVYLISKDAVQNIPDAMIGTGLLTIKNMGLFTSIEIVDSNKQQYIWGGWNSEPITSSSWK